MKRIVIVFVLMSMLAFTTAFSSSYQQTDNPNPPAQVVKLIFIHHSTGENWLTDGYGDLGRILGENNYFVSDTNYGWGPDAIGDRTDIPNWLEWFRSEQTDQYMKAVFSETGQNSSYTRTLNDPGGENEIIMFKSCFPNSDLEGSPGDGPDPDGWLSVGHAKYVYNELLQYFATRPDKLFVVITAPPLSDATHAANARAFNEWLLNDWLRENNYTANNVAIFDFYTVLTGADHHHRWNGAQIEHTFEPGNNTARYASAPGDDHPSVEGSCKATDEFIPLLNIFYHRWKANAPAQPPASDAPTAVVSQPETIPATTGGILADFESGSADWEAYGDEATQTTISCAASADMAAGGMNSLRIDFNIAPNGWATCARFYGQLQDWSSSDGLSLSLRAGAGALPVHIDLFAGPGDARESYVYSFETSPESASGWVNLSLRWEDFHRVDWEENAGSPFSKPAQISGFGFGFPSAENAYTGTLWVDDIHLGLQPAPEMGGQSPAAATSAPAGQEPASGSGGLPFCGGAALLPLALFGVLQLIQHKRIV